MSKIDTIYIMGVSGCGKSTVGSALATKLNRPFKDGDNFHSESNIEKMRAGVPLTDLDRLPWLKTINSFAISNPGHVIACSALKKSYRSVLCEHISVVDQCGAVFILLNLKREVLLQRVTSRPGHFMPSSLLDSQLSTLEMPNQNEYNVVVIDANSENVDNIVNSIIDALKKFQ